MSLTRVRMDDDSADVKPNSRSPSHVRTRRGPRFGPGNQCARGVRHPGAKHAIERRRALDEVLTTEAMAKAIQALLEIVEREDARDSDRIAACRELLDRGLGKPVESSKVVLKADVSARREQDAVLAELPLDLKRQIISHMKSSGARRLMLPDAILPHPTKA